MSLTSTAGLSHRATHNMAVGRTPDDHAMPFPLRRDNWNGWIERLVSVAVDVDRRGRCRSTTRAS